MKTVLYFSVRQSSSAREINAGVLDSAHKLNWNLQTIEVMPSVPDLREMLKFWSPDGCIVMCARDGAPFPISELRHVPLVCIDRVDGRERRNVAHVRCDNAAVARVAAHELLSSETKSHVFIRSEKNFPWCRERETEFARLLKMNGKRLVSVSPGRFDDTGCVQRIAGALERLPKPIAVFAANDAVAEKTLAACRRLGFAVPDDVALLGVDDDPDICEYATPTLSSIGIDFRASGKRAAEALHAMMSGSGKDPTSVTYPPTRVIRRESTRRLKKADSKVNEALEMIRKDLRVTAAKVAATFPCSRRMAEIRFRAATGRSILEEIQLARLDRAKELIGKRSLQIAAIADFCGYRSAAAFSKFFRAMTGSNPVTSART